MPDLPEIFERDRTAYEQNFEQFRDLNRIMWQVPMLGVTITGGFWYAALMVTQMAGMNRALFVMCAVLDFALIAVLVRMRYVMSEYLLKLERFNPASFVRAKGKEYVLFSESFWVVGSFCFALLAAGTLSLIMAFDPQMLVNGK